MQLNNPTLSQLERATGLNPSQTHTDVALLLLRVAGFVLLCFGHGLQKWNTLIANPEAFPDPLHIGHSLSIITSMATECGASALVALGLLTRLSCLPVIFTMSIVAIVVHAGDPWPKTEPSVLFLLAYSAIALLGPGKYSLDALLLRKVR